jgi:hypothetical protein
MNKPFSRICSFCGGLSYYSNNHDMNKAIRKNQRCRKCADRDHAVRMTGEGNPRFGVSVDVEVVAYIAKALRERTQTPEDIERNRRLLKDNRRTGKRKVLKERHKEKLRQLTTGIKRSESCRQKHRELHLARIERQEGPLFPNYSRIACQMFDEINKELGWSGQHAEHIGEARFLGWFVDYYEPTQNIIIEFDDLKHERPEQRERDRLKEKELIELLGCKFIRIKQGQEANWRQIIQS